MTAVTVKLNFIEWSMILFEFEISFSKLLNNDLYGSITLSNNSIIRFYANKNVIYFL